MDAEAENLAKQYYKGHDAEKTERIKYSIKLICELMDKGVEIHPALKASGEIGKLFPDYANLSLIESRIRELSTWFNHLNLFYKPFKGFSNHG